MKLYTEEQVKQLLFDLGDALFNNCQNGIKEGTPKKYSQTLLKDLTPIELPSDEEIEQEAHIQYPVNLQPNGRTLAGGRYDIDINYSERYVYILSAKNLIDKIKGGNK